MGLESATYVNDLVTTNPAAGDQRSQGDDHLRLIKAALKATFPNADHVFSFPNKVAFTINDTLDSAAEQNIIAACDATAASFTLTLPTLGASDEGWQVRVKKTDSTVNTVTIAGTIEGLTNYILYVQYEYVVLEWDGSIWAIMSESNIERLIPAKTAASVTLATTELNTTIRLTPGSGNQTVTLPTAVGIKGKWYKLKRTAFTSLVTLDGNASETIDGTTTYPVFGMQWLKIISDGANWQVADEGGRPGWGRPGTMQVWGSETAPTGAVLCYGQAISRTAFADAFAVHSTSFGVGDGATTWNVPDIRGRAVVGVDDMGGSSANRLTGITGSLNGDTIGAVGGAEGITLAAAESGVPAHTHTMSLATLSNMQSGGSKEAVVDTAELDDGTASFTTAANAAAAAASAHNNVQPSIAIPYIMWT